MFYRNKEADNNQNVLMETLLTQLKKSEGKNRKLLEEKAEIEQKNEQLNIQVTQLRAKLTKVLTNRQKEAEAIAVNALQKVFTPGQITMLMSSTNKRVKWSPEDIMSAISLRSISPKVYKYLRNVKKMPLPCLSTLQNWIAQFNVLSGILKDVINIMSIKGRNLSTSEKLTVLTFDDIYVSNKLDIEQKQQKVYGSHTTCQFIMARGLFKNWRQPVITILIRQCPAIFYLLSYSIYMRLIILLLL